MSIKYKWLAGRLREQLPSWSLRGINRLPTEQELCRRYKVSRQTVRSALELLEQEGLIEKRRGSGSYLTGLSEDPAKNVIAVLLSSDQDYIYPGVLSDIRGTLLQNGFSMQVFVTDNRTSAEREILEQLLENPPRGLIAEGCKSALPNPNLALYRRLEKKGSAVLFLYNYYPELQSCLYLKDDNAAGSALLVSHLAAQGHTAIGGIFKFDDMQGIQRFQGFQDAMRELGLPVPDERVGWYGSAELDALRLRRDTRFLERFVQESLGACTAVICYNDMAAYYLLQELNRAGYRLPEDMAVAAFDNTYLSNSDILTVTTLSHRAHEMGTRAAQMIVDKLKGLPVSSMEAGWILNQKESTKVPPQPFFPDRYSRGLQP